MSDFDDVMAALRDGQRFQIGGGRCFPTYAMEDGQLVVIQSDEGHTEQYPYSEDALRAAIADAPHAFRTITDWWKAHRTNP